MSLEHPYISFSNYKMTKIKFTKVFLLLFLGASLSFIACSEDSNDPKYTSHSPRFSNVTFKSLDGSSTLRAGQPIVITAEQSTYGKLLNGTTYEWSCVINDSTTYKKTKGTIYDYDNSNPCDTITINKPGRYTIKLDATYKISGLYDGSAGTVNFENGGSVSYSTSPFKYFINIEKPFTVE